MLYRKKAKPENFKVRGSVAILGLLLPMIAFADDSKSDTTPVASSQTVELEKVVVNSRKRSELNQDVPLSISTVSGSTLERDGDYSIQDVAEKVPSLQVSPSNPRQTSISIRGLGKNSANDGLETSVGVYVDGVYLSQPGQTAFDQTDLDQIEVLRGPQGTLFGKNNTGGALNITTLKPSFTPATKVEAIIGNYGTEELHASTTAPISETTAYRLTAYDRKRDGAYTNLYNGEKVGGFDRKGIRGQLLYLPTADLTFRGIVEHYESADNGAPSEIWNPRITYANGALAPLAKTTGNKYLGLGYTLPPQLFDPWARTENQNVVIPVGTTQDAASLQATWNLGAYTLDSITAYRHYTFFSQSDGDGTPLDIYTFGGTVSKNSQYSQELRLSSPTGKQFDYVAGLYYYHDNLWSDTPQQAGSQYAAFSGIALNNPNALTHLRQDVFSNPIVDSYAVFTQANFHITDTWTATGGLRETRESKSAILNSTVSGGADPSTLSVTDLAQRNAYLPLGPLGSTSASFTNSALSWTASLSHRINEDVNTYVTASKGFKSGGINAEVPFALSIVVAPETALDFEAGIKSQWSSKRLQLNANVYDEKIENYQGTFTYDTSPTTTANYIANVGDVRIRGAEIELDALPIESLRLNGGISYNEATYLNFTNGACPPEYGNIKGKICDFSGRQLPSVPLWTAKFSAQYTFHLNDGLKGYLGGNEVFNSAQNVNTSLSSYGQQSAYAFTNLQAGITGRSGAYNYDLSVWARNAFDKRYVTAISGSATLTATLSDPRTLGTTLRLKF